MADQINFLGSLASGLPSALLAAAAPKPTEKVRPAKIADSQAQERPGRPASESVQTPEMAMHEVNGHLEQTNSELKFQVDQGTGRTVFKIVNPNSGEVVLQVPSEEMLALARNLRALDKQTGASSGVLMDKEG